MILPLVSARWRWRCGVAALSVCWFLTASSRAVILFGTGEPTANTTAPTGALADSGWQFEGEWGGFLGTPIAPHFFLSAGHIGRAGPTFDYAGVSYHIVKSFPSPNSDFLIWQVEEAFPTWAPLYTKTDETGHSLVVIGRGTDRGAEITLDGALRGWGWAAIGGTKRWGQNTVSDIATLGPGNDTLYAAFDQNAGPNEAHLSGGDSGGGVFINDQGVWKLAGINYAVDGPLYTDASGGGQFFAALFDARGFYYNDGSGYVLLEGNSPIQTGFYATRVSSKLGWIYSVIDPTGDLDGDGIPNLIEYALRLDPLAPNPAGLPRLAQEGGALTLTYTKNVLATDIAFTVEESADLASWTAAQSQDQTVSTANGVQTIKSSVAFDVSQPRFLRLKITRP